MTTDRSQSVVLRVSAAFHDIPIKDLEPGTMDSVRAGPFGQLFRPDNFVHLAEFRQTV